LKDREHNSSDLNKIGRSFAVIGLFLSGCGPSFQELRKDPILTNPPTSLRTDHYHIDRISPHVFKAVGEGMFSWNFEETRDVAAQYLINKCKVEAVIPGGWSIREKLVIVEDANCLSEVKW